MDEFYFIPEHVCPASIKIKIQDACLAEVEFEGGCEGNLEAICRLVQGMPVQQVIARLKGIDCGGKGTSCPDQLAAALDGYLTRQAQASQALAN
jgi:uncharacterized protein (TIGR03905 family)